MIKLSIYIKLIIGFTAIIAIMILSNAYVLFELNAVADGAKNILTSTVKTQELARQLHPAVQNETEYAGKYLVSKDDAIKRSIDKITAFSIQYLELAKIETGAMQYKETLSDIHKIVEPVVNETKRVATSKNIEVALEGVAVPKVLVAMEKVSIIISNLISNAIKYTHKNGKINVNIDLSDLGVQVAIKDSGIGINQEELSSVFDRFYQASNIEKIESNGSGVHI